MNRPTPFPKILCVTLVLILVLPVSWSAANAEEVVSRSATTETIRDISYLQGDSLSPYQQERCRLDLNHPARRNGEGDPTFPTVVWFHGGGLKSGEKSFPKPLLNQGVAMVAVNYRLHPMVQSPAYIEDAAAAVAWTFKNIHRYGGDPDRIYVSGHSAGGYLTSMIGMDKRWLAAHDIDADRIAGLIPYSGHTITHFTIRKERGIEGTQPIVDDMAPLFHVRKDAPPMLLITGDRELEMMGRYEENAYLWRMMKVVGHANVDLLEMDGYNHGQMADPAHPLLLRFINRTEKKRREDNRHDRSN